MAEGSGGFGIEIIYAGETLSLLAQHAVWWPAQNMVLIADTHWGKGATFRAASIPIPGGSTASDLARLSGVISQTGAKRLVILGDVLHSRQGRSADVVSAISDWCRQHANLQVLAIQGNHDRHAGAPPAEWGFEWSPSPVTVGPFVLQHEPPPSSKLPAEGIATLCGHLHPCVRMHGPARESLRLPCFHVSPQILVLPAFSSFAGGHAVDVCDGDRVYAIAGDEVVGCELVPSHSRSVTSTKRNGKY